MPLDSMPSEVLLKILSYLDAATLLCAGCVNRRFYHLANDNFIWVRIYATAFSPKRYTWCIDSVESTAESMQALSVKHKEAGYWKKEYITRQIAAVKAVVGQRLKPVNPYTGLPSNTKEALRLSGLGWVIILRDKDGKEHVLQHDDLRVNDSSVTVVWHGRDWPRLAALTSLDLCGVMPVFMDQSKPRPKNGTALTSSVHLIDMFLHGGIRHSDKNRHLKTPELTSLSPFSDVHVRRPCWHSLLAKYSLSNLTDSAAIGSDRLVRSFCLSPGLLVGLWRRTEELAFVTASLHLHELLERSTLGSAAVPYKQLPHGSPLDNGPDHGLGGYQLHINMHGSTGDSLCSTYHNLFTSKGSIENGYVKLTVIHFQDTTEHLPLGEVGLSWRAGVFDGCMKSCSIMDITLLDEYGRPFWCFSSPVCLRPCPSPQDGPHFMGQTYCIHYQDPAGAVCMKLVWVEETEEYFIISLVLQLSVVGINRWFGTHY